MKRNRLSVKKKRFEIKPMVVILGDGETERSYVNRLREIKMFDKVNIKFEKGDEENFESKLKEHLNNQKNVFLILDIDNEQSHTKRYDKIMYLIEKYEDKVFYNNYSFETWLINHKNSFSKPIINKNEYDQEIENNFNVSSWSGYKNKKNRDKIMLQITKENVIEASLNISNISKNKWGDNPSSNMNDLIEEINKVN